MSQTRKTRILVIAAPFGYGPAARALLISHALSEHAEISLFSNMDALRFIEHFLPPNATCRSGIFNKTYPEAADLEDFDFFISVNNEPAIFHLIRLGFASRSIFVDSVLPWRSRHISPDFPEPIRAYLVQDFPGTGEHLASCQAHCVELVAPTIWSSLDEDPQNRDAIEPITLHLGGVTSPVAGWQTQEPLVEAIAKAALMIARHYGRKLVLLGNSRLASLSVCAEPDVTLLGGVSPPEAAAAIGHSAILLSTPGISAIYEAFAQRVPCIVLPPMNSTQLHQYKTFTANGIPGSIVPGAANELFQATASIRWDEQSAFCMGWLTRNLSEAFGRLVPEVAQLLDPVAGPARRTMAVQTQHSFFDRLSKLQAVDVLQRIIDAK